MGGNNATKEVLNRTLIFFANLLHEQKIDDWFIAYGTLLGIIRENGCIEGDDDVDIIINKKYYNVLKQILIEKGFEIEYGMTIGTNTNILKTKETDEFCSIDFYMASVSGYDYFDSWENVVWSNCLPLLRYNWMNTVLHLPNDAHTKLVNRYGDDWKIPQQNKGVFPRKKII